MNIWSFDRPKLQIPRILFHQTSKDCVDFYFHASKPVHRCLSYDWKVTWQKA